MASNGNESRNEEVGLCHSDNSLNKSKISATQNNGISYNNACQVASVQSSESETENGSAKDSITEEMVRQRAFRWCRDSMGGAWTEIQSGKDLDIVPISGGMTNYLYRISLPDYLAKSSREPIEVLLRIYGEISKSTMDFLIHNSVVFALLAEKGLGPKPFGMYHDGRIEEYIKADPLLPVDLRKPEVMTLVAEKLAMFHTLDMPLSKKPSYFKSLVRGWLKDITNNHSSCSNTLSALKDIAPSSFDLQSEFEALLTIASDLQAPVVFCHNDLQGGNLLLAHASSPAKDRMTIIDWEYSHYNYRGFDMGNHFNEWTFDYSSLEKPGFECIPEYYPTKEQQYEFFKTYLGASEKVEITEDILYRLYKETNTLALHSHFLWGIWSIVQDLTSSIDFDYSAYCLCRFTEYFKLKKRLPSLLENKS